MRSLIPALVLIGAASGCTDDSMYFEQRSTLESRTSSLVLYDEGVVGHGSMNEQTCKVDTFSGRILQDNDLPTPSERIEDARGEVAIAISEEGIHVLDSNGWDQANDIAVAGVLHSRMTEVDVASLIEDEAGCRVEWRNDDHITSTALDSGVCTDATDFEVDAASGQAWVAHGTAVTSVTLDGTSEIAVEADLLATDVYGNLFAARTGSEQVSALDASGAIVWSATASGAVTGMTDFGARGAVAVVVEHGNSSELEAFDAEDGEQLANYSLPGHATPEISLDASTLALITLDRVYFYDVMEGEAPVRINEVDTQPPQMFND